MRCSRLPGRLHHPRLARLSVKNCTGKGATDKEGEKKKQRSIREGSSLEALIRHVTVPFAVGGAMMVGMMSYTAGPAFARKEPESPAVATVVPSAAEEERAAAAATTTTATMATTTTAETVTAATTTEVKPAQAATKVVISVLPFSPFRRWLFELESFAIAM